MAMAESGTAGGTGGAPANSEIRKIISDIIEESFEHLYDGSHIGEYPWSSKSQYTCDAIWRAFGLKQISSTLPVEAQGMLEKMLHDAGIDGGSHREFSDIPEGTERQQARILWLTWFKLMINKGIV